MRADLTLLRLHQPEQHLAFRRGVGWSDYRRTSSATTDTAFCFSNHLDYNDYNSSITGPSLGSMSKIGSQMSVFSRALVVVAVSFVALTASLPARADMLYLVCRFPQKNILDSKLEIDLTNKTVNDENAVYPATISAASIYYKIEFNNVFPRSLSEFLIDRTKGTIAWSSEIYTNVTIRSPTRIGHCTSSKTAPPTKF